MWIDTGETVMVNTDKFEKIEIEDIGDFRQIRGYYDKDRYIALAQYRTDEDAEAAFDEICKRMYSHTVMRMPVYNW